MCVIVIIYTDSVQSFPHIVIASVLVGITPGIRAALYVSLSLYLTIEYQYIV